MNKIKAIIFDYDGVIAESNKVKSDAYEQMYIPYGDSIKNKVIKHHMQNGGVSRYEKFVIYHKRFLGKDINNEELSELCQAYSEIVVEGVINSPFVDGVCDFIKKNHQYYDFFISTGTPTKEIKNILKRNNLINYFKDIYGSPEKKQNHVSKILNNNNYNNDQIVFIGDALSDRNAARLNEINFIGRYTETKEIKKEKFLIKNFLKFNDFLNTNFNY